MTHFLFVCIACALEAFCGSYGDHLYQVSFHVFHIPGDTLPNAELCATVNDIYPDERVNDRQCFIAFKNWGDMSAEEISRRTSQVSYFDPFWPGG